MSKIQPPNFDEYNSTRYIIVNTISIFLVIPFTIKYHYY